MKLPITVAAVQVANKSTSQLANPTNRPSELRGASTPRTRPAMRSCSTSVPTVSTGIRKQKAQFPLQKLRTPCFCATFLTQRIHVNEKRDDACGVNFFSSRGLACCVCISVSTRRNGAAAVAATVEAAMPVPAGAHSLEPAPRC